MPELTPPSSPSASPQGPRPSGDPTLMRALGQFFGEVWKGVKADPTSASAGGDPMSRRTVEEREVQTEQGRVILRRTTIEEVIVPDGPARGVQGTDPGPHV